MAAKTHQVNTATGTPAAVAAAAGGAAGAGAGAEAGAGSGAKARTVLLTTAVGCRVMVLLPGLHFKQAAQHQLNERIIWWLLELRQLATSVGAARYLLEMQGMHEAHDLRETIELDTAWRATEGILCSHTRFNCTQFGML